LIRRAAFHNPTTNGPNALRLAVQALTSTANAPRTIAALSRSTSSAILSYCYSTTTKNTQTPASAFSAPVTPDCSNETAAAARTYATMDPHEQEQENKTGLNDWKTKAPYKMHDPTEHFEARHEAACHCGKVEYELSREEPLDSKLCHCTTCQTQHGMFCSYIPVTRPHRKPIFGLTII